MARKPRRLCSCQAVLNDDGTCPHGCENFSKPHATHKAANARARHATREAQSMRGCGIYSVRKGKSA